MENNMRPLQGDFKNNVKETVTELNLLIEENERLSQENSQLKKAIFNEQLLHRNLYKQWKELKEKKQEELQYKASSPMKLMKPALVPALLFITLLFIWALYNLYFKPAAEGNNESGVSTPAITSVEPGGKTLNEPSTNKAMENNVSLNSKEENFVPRDKVAKSLPPSNKITNTTHSLTGKAAAASNSNNSVIYKIKSKAYFYNEPDATTRRNAFVNHWNNSYANLEPLNDEKGFIYVVFTNHMGQTSKGWLRKSDLFAVDKKLEE